MLASVNTLFTAIVDYAGLFPPAQLSLRAAMANYAKYQSTSNAWMLGRFILPITQLDSFKEIQPEFPLTQWPLSVIVSGDLQSAIHKVKDLKSQAIAVQALEFPPIPAQEIAALSLPDTIQTFFEIPIDSDLKPYLTVLQRKKAAAKVRTGGITASAFPSSAQLCKFIVACAQAQISYKATAGLHHLLAGTYRLTYETNSDFARMHGFLNVALVSTLIYWQKITLEESIILLEEDTLNRFQVTTHGVRWHQYSLSIVELAIARQQFFQAFGSCSFEEPTTELQNLQALETQFGG